MSVLVGNAQWAEDCERWRGEVLTGKYSHWCHDWDFLPVDETTREFTACSCWEVGADAKQLDALQRAQQAAREREEAFWLGLAGLGE
jgi:zona occludens toxin (predicted ATPase)